MIPGIDVSHYQGVIRWDRVQAAGIQFTYIKASDGSSYQDRDFSWNWKRSKENSIPRGAYHFFRPGVAGQLQLFINVVSGTFPYGGELPPAVDLEVGPLDEAELSEVLELLIGLEQYSGRIPVLYVDFYTASQKLTDPKFARYPLWIADYQGEPSVTTPSASWIFWQHTPAGLVDGVPGQVDLDWFNGTSDQLLNVGKLPT